MKPHRHVQYIISRALKRIYVIRRLKSAGCASDDLIYVYVLLIRSILETACPVFQPMLTCEDKSNIERIQKIALRIILGNRYVTYDQACNDVKLSTLEQRRIEICLNFGLKCLRHPHHKTLFPCAIENGHFIRSPAVIQQTTCRTTRYQKSPVPYISKLLDDHFINEREMLETETVHGMN